MTNIPWIQAELSEFIAQRARIDNSLEADTDLLENGIIDSLMVIDLIAHVEAVHQVSLCEADISPQHFRTIARLAALVAEKEAGDRSHSAAPLRKPMQR